MYKLFLDTETTGLPNRDQNWEADYGAFPHVVSIAWIIANSTGKEIDREYHIIKPNGWDVPPDATKIHGISTQEATDKGIDSKIVFKALLHDASKCETIIGHNVHFDTSIIKANMLRLGFGKERFCDILSKEKRYCTMMKSTSLLRLKKWPKLGELHKSLFNEEMQDAHSAIGDILAVKRIYYKLINLT